jgi:hypothetical protein
MWLVPHMSVKNSSEMPRLIREVPRRPVHRIDSVDQCVHRPKVICHDRQEHRRRGEAHDVETVVHDVEDSRDSLQRERWDVCQDGAVLLCHETGKPDGGSVVQPRGDPVVRIVAGVGGAHVEGLREWPLDDVAEGTRVDEDVRVWQRSWWRRFVTHDRGRSEAFRGTGWRGRCGGRWLWVARSEVCIATLKCVTWSSVTKTSSSASLGCGSWTAFRAPRGPKRGHPALVQWSVPSKASMPQRKQKF